MAVKLLRKHGHHIDTKLRFRLQLYFFIALILVGILIYNVGRGMLRLDFGLIGVTVGIGIGMATSRMFHTSWNHDAKKVVSRFDIYGAFVLVIYILFEVFRDHLIAYFTHDLQVATTGFAVLAGVMVGRVLGTRGKIMQILKEQKVFE